MSEKIHPDAFHQHEALHMALFLAESVETQLVYHPYVQSVPEAAALADKAAEALQALYQLIGQKSSQV
jgi:hypothetical protein